MAYMAIINPLAYFGSPETIHRIPFAVQVVRDVFCLDQEWSMFSCPATHNYRYVVLATLRDGTQMDLLRNKTFEEVDRPEALSLYRPSDRWVQIMIDLARPHSQIFQISVIRYFAQQWNAQRAPPATGGACPIGAALREEPSGSDGTGCRQDGAGTVRSVRGG